MSETQQIGILSQYAYLELEGEYDVGFGQSLMDSFVISTFTLDSALRSTETQGI